SFGDHGGRRLQLPCALIKDFPVEDFYNPVRGRIRHLDLIFRGDTPETGLTNIRLAGLTFRIDLPGTGAESEVFATIVGYDELLAEVKLSAFRIMGFAFALPDTDEGEQAQEGIVKRWPLAQVSGVRL